jgi:autotransporter-associated beta strand protein
VINYGTFEKTGGINAARLPDDYGGALFDNQGRISIESGSLHLGGGGSWENSIIEVAPTAELRLTAGRFNVAKYNSFTGKTIVTGGEVAFNDSTNNIAADSVVNLAGGALLGSGSILGPGQLEFSAGTIAANLTIAAESHLALTGSAEKQFPTGTINNFGHSTWDGPGNFKAQGGALFNNIGEFALLSDAAFVYYNNGVSPRGRFHNAGVLRKTGGTGASSFSDDYGGWDFSNAGILHIDTGVLRLTTANSFTDAIIRGAGRVRLDSASLNFSGTTTLDGGTFQLANGHIEGTSTFGGTGTFHWSGGEIRGEHTISPGGKMLIDGPADKQFGGPGALINNGMMTWAGSGSIRGIGQSRLQNNGTFELQSDAAFIYYNNGVAPVGIVENTGTIRKAAGTGRSEFRQDYGGWRFVNSGTLEVRTGTFDPGARCELGASSRTVLRLASYEAGSGYGALSFPVAANFGGTLVIELANGFAPGTNGTFVLASYPSHTGEFTSPALPFVSGGSWKLNYEAQKLELGVEPTVTASNGAASFQAGKFELSLSGPPGQYALLQCTTNLVDWLNIETNKPFTGQFLFSDPKATNRSRFYRTVIVP